MGKIVRKTNSTTGGPVYVDVDVDENKIVRVTPIDFTDDDAESWTIEAKGRKFSPPRKTTYTAYTAGYKAMVHSDRRLLYPLRRIGFDVNGDRNELKRGEPAAGGDPKYPGYERISWDEALTTVSSEMMRIKREFGPGAIIAEPSSHHLWGNVGYRHSTLFRFMNFAGITYADHNPDSWEGWHWGGIHSWGFTGGLGNPEQWDLYEDTLKNTDMIVFWSSDPETNNGIYAAYESTVRRRWLKELGVKMVFIDPYFNHSAVLYSDKWFSPQIGTDAALAASIAYVWITEGTYDKEYVKDKVFGFEEFKAYILGESDGVPKTPEWGESETKLPAHDIRALAREWAKNKTTLAAGGLGGWGGACRGSTGMEWARMMIALIALQGMGKPGVNMYSTTQGAPTDSDFYFPGYAEGGISGDCENSAAGIELVHRMFDGITSRPSPPNINTAAGNHIPRLRVPECIMDGHFGPWRGKGFVGASIEQQFHQYEYPAPGFPKMQMYYKYGGPHIGTMGETNRYARMYRTKNLPIVVSQSIWFEGEVPFADIILPACTNFERWDISEYGNCAGYIPGSFTQTNHRFISFQMKCIEPLGESKSDYEIFRLLAERLGIEGPYAEGKTDLDWVKQYFYATDLPKITTWEKFTEKGYVVVPYNDKRKKTPGMRWFYEGREMDTPKPGRFRPGDQVQQKGLQTQSGRIELLANSLLRFDPDDKERPPLTQYIPSWEGHHTERFKKYPLAVVSPHPRFSFHTMGDGKDGFMNDIKDHRVRVGDHDYWIIRINTKDAEKRGIKEGDLVKTYNDRGEVILAAQITERVPPGTCHSYESSAEYKPIGVPGESADIGGCVNILSPGRYLGKNASGMATEHFLVEIEKWEGGVH
ncbi:MAG: molybdopterin-dependent oxidoreductase [Clostridiales Family XIII bacterium]|nr:molybdopterin-dependent oxidoreductase [Clostridiales Family XIII bacterium]